VSFQKRPARLWGRKFILQRVAFSLRVKRGGGAKVKDLSQSNAEVKDEWSCTYILPCSFITFKGIILP
jgi:hypothetical protein